MEVSHAIIGHGEVQGVGGGLRALASQAGLRRRPATAKWAVLRGGIQREAREARGESCAYFKGHPDRADKVWVWNLLIFIRSLDTFPEGGSQGRERTGNLAASESVL